MNNFIFIFVSEKNKNVYSQIHVLLFNKNNNKKKMILWSDMNLIINVNQTVLWFCPT